MPVGNYNLEAKSVSASLKFDKIQRLSMNTKKNSILVQTDKAMYKPSDKVQFRVIVMNSLTQPQAPASVDVVIFDGAQNRVKQFDKVKLRKGVFQGDFQLGELAVLGNWQINVKLGSGETYTKSFEVAKYTLPTFEMSIDSPDNVWFKLGKIRATCKARYTFGQDAKGKATITASYRGNFFIRDGPVPIVPDEPVPGRPGMPGRPGIRPPPQPTVVVSKQIEVDGKTFAEFDIEKELKINVRTRDIRVLLEATFVEELTGKVQKASKYITIRVSQFQVLLQQEDYTVRPGLPHFVSATVKNWDGDAPVTDRSGLVFNAKLFYDKIRKQKCVAEWDKNVTYVCRDEFSYNSTRTVPLVNGMAEFTLNTRADTTRVEIEAVYKDAKGRIDAYASETASKEYIQVNLLTKK